eukprot:m.354845 g.354845  ORF g.354845 m.354845 type:complete len:553 (-) comp17120_c0_seq1:895-2553(-)
MSEPISIEKIDQLIQHFATNPSQTRSPFLSQVSSECQALFERDYDIEAIPNERGELCEHYPVAIFVPIKERTASEPINDPKRLSALFKNARLARCRRRFPVPVLIVDGQNITRSATVALGKEILLRKGQDTLALVSRWWNGEQQGEVEQQVKGGQAAPVPAGAQAQSMDLYQADAQLLDELGVKYICDLMIEQKKVKFGMYTSSSEKALTEETDVYQGFALATVPYPGVEWFKNIRSERYDASSTFFDWNFHEVNVELNIPPISKPIPGISFDNYKEWSLAQLTYHYLHLFVHYLSQGDGGILVHCISGWDRTPLFASLLRMWYWAEGKAHTSLTSEEMVYLTIGYDWLLFGHQLDDRLDRGEEIFLFCFHMLKYLQADDFDFPTRDDLASCSRSTASSSNAGGAQASKDDGVVIDDADPITPTSSTPTLTPTEMDGAHAEGISNAPATQGDTAITTGIETTTLSSSDTHSSSDSSAPIAVPRKAQAAPSAAPAQVGSIDSWQCVDALAEPVLGTSERSKRLQELQGILYPLYIDVVQKRPTQTKGWFPKLF